MAPRAIGRALFLVRFPMARERSFNWLVGLFPLLGFEILHRPAKLNIQVLRRAACEAPSKYAVKMYFEGALRGAHRKHTA